MSSAYVIYWSMFYTRRMFPTRILFSLPGACLSSFPMFQCCIYCMYYSGEIAQSESCLTYHTWHNANTSDLLMYVSGHNRLCKSIILSRHFDCAISISYLFCPCYLLHLLKDEIAVKSSGLLSFISWMIQLSSSHFCMCYYYMQASIKCASSLISPQICRNVISETYFHKRYDVVIFKYNEDDVTTGVH